MKNEYLVILIITLLSKSVISENYLILELFFSQSPLQFITTTFYDKNTFYISFSHSKLISKESSNLQNINITDDDSYPSKRTKHGLLANKYIQISQNINISLNYVNRKDTKNYLGLSKGVEYDNTEIMEKYNLDFVSQLIEQKVIDKYYIYFPALFDENDKVLPSPYLSLGMIPNIFQIYSNQTSYAPLNPKYPKKWSLTLSHIIYEDTYNSSDNPIKKQYSIYADVILTNSGGKDITVPTKYRDIFDEIFIFHLNCQLSSSDRYKCDPSKISKFKLFLVFNGFSHLLSNGLISYSASSSIREFYIKFDKDIDFIGIDGFTFGNYYFLFDGEDNFIRLMNKKENFISDVSDACGYENRDGIPWKPLDKEYLFEWEQRLKKESIKFNETLEEFEKNKTELEKEQKILQEEIKLCKSDVLKQEVENLRKDIETKEKDKTELNEQISKNKTLMIMLIVQIILTVITAVIIIFFFCRAKRRENKIENFGVGLVDKSIN
jgi:hypothetical protein